MPGTNANSAQAISDTSAVRYDPIHSYAAKSRQPFHPQGYLPQRHFDFC